MKEVEMGRTCIVCPESDVYRIVVVKPRGELKRRPLGMPTDRWQDNIRFWVKGLDCITLHQDIVTIGSLL
jgi:hypothetical protein